MANLLSLTNGQGETLDPLIGTDGTVYLKAAGDPINVPSESDDSAPELVQLAKAATGTLTNVASSASSVTLLAANVLRKGATIVNDSSALLYVKLSAGAASTTSYSVVLAGAAAAPFAYVEVPFSYSGEIRGIWASATGNARITELT